MNIGLILISFLLNAQERDDPLHLLSVNQTGFHNQIKYHAWILTSDTESFKENKFIITLLYKAICPDKLHSSLLLVK